MTQGPVIPPPPNGMPGFPATPNMMPPPFAPSAEVRDEIEAAELRGNQSPAEPERRRRRRRTAEQIAAENGSNGSGTSESITPTLPPPLPEDHTGPITEPALVSNLRPQSTPAPNPVAEGNAKPKFWVSAGATINIGNYESFKIDMGVSGIDYDADSAEIERIINSANVGIQETVDALMVRVIERGREIKIARGIPVPNEDD